MDYEKKYKEMKARVLEMGRGYVKGLDYSKPRQIAEYIDPELKESEDERIRKKLIELFHDTVSNDEIFSDYGLDKTEVLAWLEKQVEQKLADKVIKPKFHEGEWVVFNNRHDSVYQVEKIENYEYTLRHFLGGSMPLSFSHEDMIRAWTVKDARDGDVLTTDGDYPCLFKSINEGNGMFVYCGINAKGNFATNAESKANIWDDEPENYCPATKEQRDLLFAKMKEAGYEWLEETKELKKIEQKSAEWSEEDERMCQETIYWFEKKCFPYALESENPARESIKWLKSLKERIGWKPGIAQLNALSIVSKGNAPDDIEAIVSLYNDLKKLREE